MTKINNEIVTTYDIEKEKNYLLALNSKLNQISENQLIILAKNLLQKKL